MCTGGRTGTGPLSTAAKSVFRRSAAGGQRGVVVKLSAGGDVEAPLVRLRSPAQVVEAVPYLIGYHPSDSVVVVSTRGPHGRVGLTLRLDLPPPEHHPEAVQLLVEHLVADRAQDAVVVFYCPASAAFWPLLRRALAERGIGVREALRVHDGRWWSYLCADPRCCPVDGTEIVPGHAPGGEAAVAASFVRAGRAVLASREALADMLCPVDGATRVAMEQALDRVDVALERQFARCGGIAAWRAEARRRVEAALAARLGPQPAALDDDDVAQLLAALLDIRIRDAATEWVDGDRGRAAMSLWAELVRRAPAPYDVAPATLLANASWRAGDGAFARIAVERALTSDPTYRLALLIQQVLDAGIPPDEMRGLQRPARRRRRR